MVSMTVRMRQTGEEKELPLEQALDFVRAGLACPVHEKDVEHAVVSSDERAVVVR